MPAPPLTSDDQAVDLAVDPAIDPAVDEELVGALRTGVMRLARRLRLERSGNDLTLTQLSALGALHRLGTTTIGELANVENVKPPSITRTVNCLEEAGLVSRRAHEFDGRQVVVGLTAKAEAVLQADRQRRDAWLKTHLGGLTEAERALLRRVAPLLDRMAQE